MNKFVFLFYFVYKKIFSIFLLSSCKCYPSCSVYIFNTYCKYTFLISLYFSIKRLLKCNLFFLGGFDPSN